MPSYLGWVDFAERDRNDVLDLIRLLRKQDTRDELGVGTIRDAFSDYFFPGTSTIQTRPRYFLLVPWVYQEVERRLSRRARRRPDLATPKGVHDMLRGLEVGLIEVMVKDKQRQGVIGRTAGRHLERFPSSIYWSGLGRLGIRQWDMPQGLFHRWLAQRHGPLGAAAVGMLLDMKKDEADETLVGDTKEMWCRLPEPPEGFPTEVDLNLTEEEARFLMERLAIRAKGSLLDFLMRSKWHSEEVYNLWDHPAITEVPDELANAVNHARRFSEVHHLAALLYNLMLAEKVENDERIDTFHELIEDFGDELSPQWSSIQTWCDRFDECWHHPALIPARSGGLHVARTHRFLKTLCRILSVCPEPETVVDRYDARQLVEGREAELKLGRARLRNPAALNRWSGASGTVPLYFRWGTAQWFVNDVRRALGTNDHSTDDAERGS